MACGVHPCSSHVVLGNGATTEELCVAAGMSEPAMAKKRKCIKELGFLRETHKGRQRFCLLDLGKME